ncbi:MAG: sulfatase-like hydrolase/transferase, partial [Oscillospiraceae bacterium]|nr:sulfatase-like hydrolase/transferase [Oscillospiraceae bacterium]
MKKNLSIHENSHDDRMADEKQETECAVPSDSRKKSRSIWSVLFLPLIFAYCETLLRVFNGNYIPAEYIYPCIFGISAGLLAAAVLSFFPPKINRVCTTVILFVMGVAFASECLIKKNFQIYMTPASIFAGVGGVVGKYTSNLAASMLGGILEIILFFAPLLIYAVLGKKLTFAPSERVSPVCSVVSALCAAALFGTGVFLSGSGSGGDKYEIRSNFDSTVESLGLLTAVRLNIQNGFLSGESESGFVAETPQTVTSAAQTEYISETDEDSEAIPVNAANVYPPKTETETETDESSEPTEKTAEKPDLGTNRMDIDFDAALSRNPNAVISELNNYVRSLTPSNKNEYTGLFKGKNLILICAEAFSDAVVSEELTPTLYRMSHNGIYFSDYYQPTWGGSTTTGEFSFVTGLVPESGLESMLKIQDNNNYFTLGNQLQRQNYTSCAFHNGQFDYYSRNLTHTNLGY